jgi:hypothetical protein
LTKQLFFFVLQDNNQLIKVAQPITKTKPAIRHKMAESQITSATNLGGGYTFQIYNLSIYIIDMNKQKQQPKNKKESPAP